MFKNILLPTDGSPASEKAAESCIALALNLGARITAMHVVPMLHLYTYEVGVTEATHDQLRKEREVHSQKYLDHVEQRARAAGVPCETLVVLGDEPYEAIIDTARDRNCDLIAMASHGRRGIAGLLLGSQTQKVLTHSVIPVLVYR